MSRLFTLIMLIVSATWVMAKPNPITVDCGAGQSLNRALAKMDKHVPATVEVKGTCTEYVLIDGFDGLTLKGVPGAALVQPSVDPGDGLAIHVLSIRASRSITIFGLDVHSGPSALAGIGIGQNSLDVRLRNLTVDGAGVFGIVVYESSQVSLARVTARDPGYATVGVYDVSDVHIEDCLFAHSTGAYWHAGVDVGSGHVTMHGTTIRNMQNGINIGASGSVDIQDYNTYYPLGGRTEVVIESPASTNFCGVNVGNGSSLNVGNANLRITNSGQTWGGNTAGVCVSDGGTLNAVAVNGGKLFVSGSYGHGVFVSNSSHASLAASSITGSGHGGLVVVNQSTISVGANSALTEVSGNGTDLFCDSKSLMTGGANIGNATSVNCNNLLLGDYENLP
jgi:hypothetical protein